MKKALLFLLSISLLFHSCNSTDFEPRDIEPITIGRNTLNGNEGVQQSNRVITNQIEWQSLVNQMDMINNVSSQFTETNIDFNNYMIIAIILNVKTSGYDVEITNVTEYENNITVSKNETEYITAVMSQPFHIIKIPKSNKEIVFL